jgi:prepilin-type N-terminal cleavage/methylation domain-containing protein
MRRRAFTLIEMLVVVAVVGILAALLLPALQRARALARMRQCQSRLKNVGTALELYHDQYGRYPRARQRDGYGPLVALLPFVEQQPAFNSVNFSFQFFHPVNYTVANTRVELFLCPTDAQIEPPGFAGWARSNYVFNTGSGTRPDPGVNVRDRVDDPTNIFYPTDGVFYGFGRGRPLPPVFRSGIRDGATNTAFASETLLGAGPNLPASTAMVRADRWYAEYEVPSSPHRPITQWLPSDLHQYSGQRQVSWMGGSYGNGLYNHYLRPNDTSIDRIGWVYSLWDPRLGMGHGDLAPVDIVGPPEPFLPPVLPDPPPDT